MSTENYKTFFMKKNIQKMLTELLNMELKKEARRYTSKSAILTYLVEKHYKEEKNDTR